MPREWIDLEEERKKHYKDACYQNGLKVAGQAVAAAMRGDTGVADILTTRARSLMGLPPTPSAT